MFPKIMATMTFAAVATASTATATQQTVSGITGAQRAVALRGTVTGILDGGTKPIAGAAVVLERPGAVAPNNVVASVVTDSSGNYVVTNPIPSRGETQTFDVPPGTYVAYAAYRSTRSETKTIALDASSTHVLNLSVGTVVQGGGAPPPAPSTTFFASDRELVAGSTALASMFMNTRIIDPCDPDPDCAMSYGMSVPSGPILGPAQLVPTGTPSRVHELVKLMNAQFGNPQSLLIFVHGYNNDFFSQFQIGATWVASLDPHRPVLVYSWPSNAKTVKYLDDETNNTWGQDHFRDFLLALLNDPDAPRTIDILAHSMGNRIVANALDYIGSTQPTTVNKINQVVFAAPDVDSGTFFTMIPTMAKAAKGLTMYASSHDMALIASKDVHGHCRAGIAGCDYAIPNGANFDAIDASIFYCDFFGHGYWAESNTMLADIESVYANGLNTPQATRAHLKLKNAPNSYYFFEVPANDDSCKAQAIGD